MIGTRIGNIRLEALLGEGGMGQVYSGFDEKLERRVAVKTIPSHRRLKPETEARFLREARLLSRLEHPNICRVYDLVEGEDSDFLVLEYIEGQNLRQVLDQDGEFDPLRVAEEVASALAAAHQRQVVHRDLKPENIMLAPSGEAKVLDFGLACSTNVMPQTLAKGDLRVTLWDGEETEIGSAGNPGPGVSADSPDSGTFYTEQGAVLGTLGYMSPEQASGEEVTVASDMYGLGILLQEMVTGQPAYGAARGMELLVKVGRGESLPAVTRDEMLRDLVEDLNALQPKDRPGAEETIRRLRQIRMKPRRRRRQRLLVCAAAVIVLLLTATAFVTYRLGRPEPLLAAGTAGRIALLPFENATANPGIDWVELGLLQIVAETIDATDDIEVVPIEEVLQGVKHLQADGSSLSEVAVNRLLRGLGAALAVRTSVVRTDRGYGFRYQVLRPQGRPLSKLITASELTAGAAELARRLVLLLRPEAPTIALSDLFSEDLYVNQTYATGLQRMSAAGPETARHYFEVCLDLDPEMQWARLGLAKVLHSIGANSDGDGLLDEVSAAAQDRSDSRLAAAVLRQRGTVQLDRGDYPTAADSFARSLALDEKTGQRNGIVSSLNQLAVTAYYAGDVDLAEQHWKHAMVGARQLGSRSWEARLMNNLGLVAYERNDPETAERLWSQAIEAMRDMGNLAGEALIMGNLGMIAEAKGDLGRARDLHHEELTIQRRLGDRQAESIALYNLGIILKNLGEWQTAEEILTESATLAQEVGQGLIEVLSLVGLGELDVSRGDLEQAEQRIQRARSLADGLGQDARVAILGITAYLCMRQGDLAAADKALSQMELLEPEDCDTTMLRARWHFAGGRLSEALAVAKDTREREGNGWTAVQEADRRAFEVAVELNHAVPLPSESWGKDG